MIINNNQNV